MNHSPTGAAAATSFWRSLTVCGRSAYRPISTNARGNQNNTQGRHEIRRRDRDQGRPFTGAEYLESLRDGREVYIYGERVKDVTTHPAFRNAARSIARLYDALHDEKTKGRPDLADRYRLRRLYPQILPRRALARGTAGAARRHRALGAHVLRLDGALAGLQGVADEHARRQLRLLRQIRRQRARPGTGARRKTCCS